MERVVVAHVGGDVWQQTPHATNLPKLAAKNVKNQPGAEFDTEIGACGTEHFLSFAERADYSGAL